MLCALLLIGIGQARHPVPSSVRAPFLRSLQATAGVAVAATQATDPALYLAHSVSSGAFNGMSVYTVSPPRQSRCELEVDIWADDILNPNMRLPHVAATVSSTSSAGDQIHALPSLMALWEVGFLVSEYLSIHLLASASLIV
jgi:hypothetical protein